MAGSPRIGRGREHRNLRDRAREERDRAAADVRSLEASVDAARDQLAYTELKAPLAGTVVATYVENFEDVQAKQAVLRILDDSRIEIVISVPEQIASHALPYVTPLAPQVVSPAGHTHGSDAHAPSAQS